MNKKKLLALLVSSAFLFAACGDDDSPSSPKRNDHEKEISSSSEEDDDCESSDECEEKSSSSKKSDKKSSSSNKDDKSSSSKKDDNKSSSSKKDDDKSSSSTKGDDDKSSSSKKSKGDSSSSTKKDDDSSSSSEDVTSSSSSSSVQTPKGTRVATLDDLGKSIKLELFGEEVYLTTGSKQGLFALYIATELWVVSYTDFTNGELVFSGDNVGLEYTDTQKAKKIKDEVQKTLKLSFVVDQNDALMYSVNGSTDYSYAATEPVRSPAGVVTKAKNLANKIYSCADGDTTRTYTFFDNSYILEHYYGKDVARWSAGHYDIMQGVLLTRVAYHASPEPSMVSYRVGLDNKMSPSIGDAMNCDVKDFEGSVLSNEEKKLFVGDWQGSKNNVYWDFSLKADGSYKADAYEGAQIVKSNEGIWDIYGGYLIMQNTRCMGSGCARTIYGLLQTGSISGGKSMDGFKFDNDDAGTPQLPSSFEVPEYE